MAGAVHVARSSSVPARRFERTAPTLRRRGTLKPLPALSRNNPALEASIMDGIIYLVGLIVIVMAILSFFGLR
jgi:hypothetical protein